MIFNSLPFLVFFIVVFFIYYFPLKENSKVQNVLLLFSSYFFYGFANWKIVPILLVATLIVFFLGRAIHKSRSIKRSSSLTTLGILTGIGLLAYFKYFNFFIDSFASTLNALGLQSNIGTFNIIMPLGISFFTFKLISYVLEIHRGKIEYCGDVIVFSTYIAFFPTILSGPIDKPNFFIPQLNKKRVFNYELSVDGCRQILWGLFQKVVIADNLTGIINNVFGNISDHSGSTLAITAILFSIQVYADFSGYSHIAIGLAKLLGFTITKNFNYPYFSRNIGEFWRNWHMSLTSWISEYIFMPLNIKFRNLGLFGLILAIVINMIAVGLWHGPNWTFIIFGLYHGLLFIPLILSGSFFKKKKLTTNKYGMPVFRDFSKIIGVFLLVSIGNVIFRADNVGHAINYVLNIFTISFFTIPELPQKKVILFVIIFIFLEWLGRESEYGIKDFLLSYKRSVRWAIYILFVVLILYYAGAEQPFFYFQF